MIIASLILAFTLPILDIIINYYFWRNNIIKYKLNFPYSKIAKLKFINLIDFYNVNPRRFKIIEEINNYKYIIYNANQKETKLIRDGLFYGTDFPENIWKEDTTVCINFSFIDFYKFKRWLKNKEKNEKLNDIKFVLDSVQLDIDKLKENSKE